MKYKFWFGFLLLFLSGWLPRTGFGQILYDLRDFYQYDNGIVKQLELAPKIYIRFVAEWDSEARAKFINELTPVSQERVRGDDFALLLGFGESIPVGEIVQKINKINHSVVVEARPVFLVNNMEAVVDGIVVEPKTSLTELGVRNRIARFGKFEIIKSVADGEGWVLLTGDIAPPLNLFILSNLVHKDTWIRRAYPYFRHLHDSIVSEFRVEPISGTVGEPRKFVWVIHIFDPKIILNEQRLPNFGEGQFMPMVSGTPPANYLFKAGKRQRLQDVVGKRSRVVTFVWPFWHYALGEWMVAPQPVAYEKDGTSGTIVSNQAKFVVTSLIGSLGIDDMPPPSILQILEKNISEPKIEFPALPVYWFDRWVKDPAHLSSYGYKISFLFLLPVGVVLIWRLYRHAERARVEAGARIRLRKDILGLCDTAEKTLSYDIIYDAASKILYSTFLQLSHRPTIGEIAEHADVISVLGESWENVQSLLHELERRHEKSFKPDPQVVPKLLEAVRALISVLYPRMTTKRSNS
ncbi:MAG: hypothetical protein UX07_C0017G0007 [Parcubacteria group bacterium GW2011_GWA2_45_30]|nr:MAG: hypothetical protein UX07_C0017G0007 [Parcubacteria group bacterium GW2011_GWA2_45_30]